MAQCEECAKCDKFSSFYETRSFISALWEAPQHVVCLRSLLCNVK